MRNDEKREDSLGEIARLNSLVEQRTAERDAARSEAERLFCLLDDIDTAEDMFKPDITPHFTYVHKKHRARFAGPISTDGYELFWGQAIKAAGKEEGNEV